MTKVGRPKLEDQGPIVPTGIRCFHKAMTLQLVLWAIPAVSLTVAFSQIGIRAHRLTRDSFVKRARLARAGNEVLRAVRPDLCVVHPRVKSPAGSMRSAADSRVAVSRPAVLRRRVIPVVSGKVRASRTALAG